MYIIIGASGYLGSYLIQAILQNTDQHLIATYSNNKQNIYNKDSKRVICTKLDISDFDQVDRFFLDLQGEPKDYKILYLSALHHPDKVEKDCKKAWDINISCLDYFLSKLSTKSKLYYSSTDSVYGQSNRNNVFLENDSLNPLNRYGRTKVLAENLVLLSGFSVIRYSLLMGPSLISKSHFYDYIVDSLQNKEQIEMFSDSFRSVISFSDASNLTIQLMEKHYQYKDIINISGDDHLSKYDTAKRIANSLGLEEDYIKSITTENQNIFTSPRAKVTLISNKKIKEILNLSKIEFLK